MEIIKKQIFNLQNQELEDFNKLCNRCKKYDGNIVANYPHILQSKRQRPSIILYYHQEKLIGFLSTYFFYADACEIALMVDPKYRRRKIATLMLQQIIPLLLTENIRAIIFSSPNGLNNTWLSILNFSYQSSEFELHRKSSIKLLPKDLGLNIRKATIEDIESLSAIDDACFNQQETELNLRLHQLLNDTQYTIFIALKSNVPIGKAHICWQQDHALLTDIAILPKFQGQGFGSALLTRCVNFCLNANQKNLKLTVSTNNINAIQLYTRLDFKVNNAYDYWGIAIDKLKF